MTVAGPATVDAVVMIGNSDDKLTQARWSQFIYDTVCLVEDHAEQVHSQWAASPFSRWQNAGVAFTMFTGDAEQLRAGLARLAADYGQDSIALLAGATEFIAAASCGRPTS